MEINNKEMQNITPTKMTEKRSHSPVRSGSSMSIRSSSSQSSRTSSASKSPCKQCQILRERMHDFYEDSIQKMRSTPKSSGNDSGVSDSSPFATPQRKPLNSEPNASRISMAANRAMSAIQSAPSLPSTISTPTANTNRVSPALSSSSSPSLTDTTLKPSIITAAKNPLSIQKTKTITKTTTTTIKRTMTEKQEYSREPFSTPKCATNPDEMTSNNRLKPKQLFCKVTLEDRIFYPLIVLITICILGLFIAVQKSLKNVFIDEYFHVSQSQEYCLRNNFSYWNNKITTPPGLYLSSYAFLRPFKILKEFVEEYSPTLSKNFFFRLEPCSITQHRFTNIVFTFLNFVCLKSILKDRDFSSSVSGLFALTLIIFPPLFFPFSFLYYTDVGSLFTLLIVLKYSQNNMIVSFFGLISLLFRQTNIIWIFYIASSGIQQQFFTLLEDVVYFSKHEFVFGGFRSSFFRPNDRNFWNCKYCFHFVLHLAWKIVTQFYGYIFNAAVFLAFLIINGGIVLGDKNQHQASIHLAQIPYFLTFAGIFALPILFTKKNIKNFGSFVVGSPFKAIVSLTFLTICLTDKFTFIHPYLLADNRHYTFYLWKKLWYRNTIVRYSMSPFYLFVAYTMLKNLHFHSVLKKQNSLFRQYESALSKLLYIFVLFITIVPQQLIEFRYFIVPLFFWRINIRRGFTIRELLYFIIINSITIIIFFTKQIFYSQSQPNERLIW